MSMNRYMKHLLAVLAALFFAGQSFGQIEAMQQKVDISTNFIVLLEKGKIKRAMDMIQADSVKAHPELKTTLRNASREMKKAMKAGATLFIAITPNEEFTQFICNCKYQQKGQTPEDIYQVDVMFINAEGDDISKVRFFDLPALLEKPRDFTPN